MRIIINSFGDPLYAETICKFYKKQGVVLVEGFKDTVFWRDIFSSCTKKNEPEFLIQSASKDGSRSKGILTPLIGFTNKYFMLGIDSDYDYVCENSSSYSKSIGTCSYVFTPTTIQKKV